MPKITAFECVNSSCRAQYTEPHFTGCPKCRATGTLANLFAVYESERRSPAQIKGEWSTAQQSGIWRFADRLPDIPPNSRLSLGEGQTPLVKLARLGKSLNITNLWLKDESQNPTWSWKDRLMAVAVSAGLAAGATAIAGSSTGNAGAALAAYASRAGLPAYIFACLPLPQTMQTLMQSLGAHVFTVPTREDRFKMVQAGVAERGWYPVTNISEPPIGSNSYGFEGYKTLAFEMAIALDYQLPDVILVPTSNGDGLFGIWRGLVELVEFGLCDQMPQLIAVRPEQADTIAFSLGKPPEALQVTRVLQETGGLTVYTPEAAIAAMQLTLGATEGLYLEAAAVVGLCALQQLDLPADTRVVVIGTSSGLKDPASTQRQLAPPPAIEPTLVALDSALQTNSQ